MDSGKTPTGWEAPLNLGVTMEDCIIWEGPLWSQGRYGRDGNQGAHRAAWIRAKGPIPVGMSVCHKCDNGLCVNPEHLFLGTSKDNMQDCKAKGRLGTSDQRGQNNGNAHPNLVKRYQAIKKARAEGMTWSQLCNTFDIRSNGHLRKILLKKLKSRSLQDMCQNILVIIMAKCH